MARTVISLDQLIDNTDDGAFVVDYSLKVLMWNRAAADLFGLSPREAIGRPCHAVVAGRDDDGHLFCKRECEPLRRARGGRPCPNYNVGTRTKAGAPLWLNVSTVAIAPDGDHHGYLVHLVRSIGRQKHIEDFVRLTLAEGVRTLAANRAGSDPAQIILSLTSREREVLRLFGRGHATAQVAGILAISPATVRTHTQKILSKLGVHSKMAAVLYAERHALL